MAKYNIYKVRDLEVDELINRLVSDRNYSLVNSISLGEFDARVLFIGPEEAKMWWLEQYGPGFFGEKVYEHNEIYSGAIIATKNSDSYILPFGKTHFYIQEFVVYNYGLEIAERIADENKAKMKSLKRFGGRTNKSLVSFNTGSSVDFSSGDSTEYLKLKPGNTDDWGKSFIHFGTSVQFSGIDIAPDRLGDLLGRLNESERLPRKFSIPLMRPISDETQKEALNKELGEKIISRDVNIEFIDYEIYGVDFVFSQQTHVQLKYEDVISEAFSDLSVDNIANFAQQNDIDLETELPNLKARIIVDGQSTHTTPLLNLIEYHSENQVLLYRGKWFVFNESFIEQLHQSLEAINLMRFPDSFSENEFDIWRAERRDGVKYREKFVIEKLKATRGYVVYDREMEHIPYGKKSYQLEVGDVYDADNQRMFVVKIGAPRDFGYAFDQASTALHNTYDGKFKMSNGTEIAIKTIVMLLLFKTDRVLERITDTNSIIFELKLDELRKLALEKGVNLEVQYTIIT